MKRLLSLLTAALLMLCLCGCAGTEISGKDNSGTESATVIELKGSAAEIKGGGASADGAVITVSAAGAYTLKGKLDEGQIIVDTGEDPGYVTLFLDGAEISNSADAAILVRQARQVTVSTVKDSENLLRSGTVGEFLPADENVSGAALFSEDDLILEGEGRLRIEGYINNAVTCKDDVELRGGYLELLSANNGLRGSESVTVSGGALDIQSVNDGIKSSSAKKAGKGYVEISGGEINVAATGDGVSAETELRISGGRLTLITEALGDKSCKAMKAKTAVLISGGVIQTNSADDSLMCDGDVTVTGGTLELLSGKKGIQAGAKNSTVGTVDISGGEVSIIAAGDGVDAKGSLKVSGGLLFSLGSSKRFKGFSEDCAQAVLEADIAAAKGQRVTVGAADKELVSSRECQAPANVLLLSAPELQRGGEYTVTVGDSSFTVTAR